MGMIPSYTNTNISAPNGSKIQPIFSHASSTLTSGLANPFLDGSPSVGTGIVNFNGNWESGNFPELYKVDMITGGAVGVATYKFSKRTHFGFVSSTYRCSAAALPGLYTIFRPGEPDSIASKPHSFWVNLTSGTAPGVAVGDYAPRVEKYDNKHIVTYDQTGVLRYNCATQVSEIWDADTTPPLNATNIRQVAVNPTDGSMWVACADTGIYRIDATGATISQFTTIDGLPSNLCYALDIGRNDAVWAVCNGGIVTSSDDGGTWSVYNNTIVGVGDPYYNSVTLLLHLDGVDGSTIFTDIKGHTVTPVGTASISTTQSKFGGSSLHINGVGNYLRVEPHADWATGTGDFTYECWVYWDSNPASNSTIFRAIGGNLIHVYRAATSNVLVANFPNVSGIITGLTPITNNDWHHIAISRRADVNGIGTIALFLDGVSQGTPFAIYSQSFATTEIYIGAYDATTTPLNGYIDDFRITKASRYESTFTPPIAAYSEVLNPHALFDSSVINGDWSDVHYMRVDPSHVGDRMFLVRKADTLLANSVAGVWWSIETSIPIQFTSGWIDALTRRTPTKFNVSDNDGIWAISTTNVVSFMTYGSSTVVTSANGTHIPSVMFVRDSTNTQDLLLRIHGGLLSNPQSSSWIFGPNQNNFYGTTTLYNGSGAIVNTNSLISGVIIGAKNADLITQPDVGVVYLGNGVIAGYCFGQYSSTSSIGGIITNLYGDGTPMGGIHKHLIWEEYGWDGANWVVGEPGAKITHAGYEPMLHGLDIKFTNGALGTSFIGGDYFTGSVNDGILKNNAMTLEMTLDHYVVPTKVLTDFNGVVSVYPYNTGVVTWRKYPASITINGDNSLTNNIPYRSYGMACCSKNRLFGDFSISGTFTTGPNQNYNIGISSIHTTEVPSIQQTNYSTWSFSVIENAVTIRNSINSTVNTPPAISGLTTWNISRVGTTITFSTAGVVRYTTTDSTYSFVIRARFADTTIGTTAFTVSQIVVDSTGPGYYVGLGNSGTNTGIYDNKQMLAIPHVSELFMDGISFSVLNQNATNNPAIGGADLCPEEGLLLCNAADVGKTITGSYVMSYQTTTPTGAAF
jgi:hypothetical protein